MWPPSPALLGTNTSYPEPIAIPSSQPGDSPTMCVPINAEWIPIVAGALQQLAQTNIWAGMTEADALAAVGAAWDLIASVANATACTVFSLQFTMGCTLQYSTDGGTTWTDVPGWDSYFAECVGGSTGGGGGAPPPDVPGLTGDVLACNMAGYLIQTLLRQVVMDAITKVVASGFLQDVIDTIVALIPGIDATTPLVIAATDALFTALATGGLATIAAGALTDLVWSKLGCVIYNALNPFIGWTTGAITNVVNAITGSGLAPDAVLAVIANYVSGLGIPALQSITAPAYITTYDCSQCGMGGTQIQSGPAGLQQIPNLAVTDGTTTIQPTGKLTVVGGRVSGSSPNAVITISGSGGGGGGSALLEQTGTVSITITAGNSDASVAVTFPAAFSGTPAIVVSSDTETVVCSVQAASSTACTVTITALTALAAGDSITAIVTWIATTGGSGGLGSQPFIYTAPPDLGLWTWTNQGGASVAANGSAYALAVPGTSGDSWALLTTAPPATPYTITAALLVNALQEGNNFGGIVLLDSGSGQFIAWGLDNQSGYEIAPTKWDSPSSYNSDYTRTPAPMGQVLWFRIQNDGTTLNFNVSNDGVNFVPYSNQSVTDFLPTIDMIGIGADANTTVWPMWLTLLSWLVE